MGRPSPSNALAGFLIALACAPTSGVISTDGGGDGGPADAGMVTGGDGGQTDGGGVDAGGVPDAGPGDGGDAGSTSDGGDAGFDGGSAASVPCVTDPNAVQPPLGPSVVFWASEPIKPNETVLVTGAALDSTGDAGDLEVEIESCGTPPAGTPGAAAGLSADAIRLAPLQSSPGSLKFVIPSSWPNGVYAYRILRQGQASPVQLLNAPQIWFIQGDLGTAGQPGGFVDIEGTSLSIQGGPSPTLALVQNGQVATTLTSDPTDLRNNPYHQRFALPPTLPVGSYGVYVHNGSGGPAAWGYFNQYVDQPLDTLVVTDPPAWPTTRYDVTLQSGATWDDKFATAINAAADAGGGVVYVPAGGYNLTQQLLLPNHTLLAGAGMDASVLTWTTNPSGPLVAQANFYPYGPADAGDNFSIEDLTLVGSPTFLGICIQRWFASGPSHLRRMQCVLPDSTEILPFGSNGPAVALELRVEENLEVSNSVLDARIAIETLDHDSYLRVEDSTIDWRDDTVFLSGNGHGFQILGNTFHLRGDAGTNNYEGDGGAAFDNPNPGFWFTNNSVRSVGAYTRDLYYGSNVSTRDDLQSLPPSYLGWTSDQNTGIYLGYVASASGTTLTLAGQTLAPDAGFNDLIYNFNGGVVEIVDGTGRGQSRVLTNAGPLSSVVTVDRPWDVPPDATSIVTLVSFEGRALIVDNAFNTEITNAEYFTSQDIIRANNAYPIGPSVLWAGQHYAGVTFGSHYQILDNVSLGAQSFLASDPAAYAGPGLDTQVFRNNTFHNNGQGYVYLRAGANNPTVDSVIEHNQADLIGLRRGSNEPLDHQGIVVRENVGQLVQPSDFTANPQVIFLTALDAGAPSLQGRVVDATDAGVAGVVIATNDGQLGQTDQTGAYAIQLGSAQYILIPSAAGRTFQPAALVVSLDGGDLTSVDFVAK